MGVAGILLRLSNLLLRALQLCTSVIILGIFAYFIGVLVDHNAPIARYIKAIVGISALATIYTLFGVILTVFLGGMMFFAMLAVALDVCFFASFIAIAVMARDGRKSCKGYVETPIGSGQADSDAPGYGQNDFGFGGRFSSGYRPNLGLACRLQKAVLALAVIGLFLFMCSIVSQLLLARHRRREKRYGPSPANDYTSGREKKFWKRGGHHDAERGVPNGGANGTTTGTTAAGANGTTEKPHGSFWKFGRHQQNGGVANGYSPAAPSQQQTATYNTGVGGTGTGGVPVGGGGGYSYVNSAPGYNVPQTTHGASNF